MESKSCGALNKLKSLYYMSAIAVPLLASGCALAIAPTGNNLGIYYGSTQITKGDISSLNNSFFQLVYDGSYQEFVGLRRAYAKAGTIYYKLGEDGTWSNEAPHLKSVGQHDVYYYVEGNSNYNDLGSAENPKHTVVKVVDWGRKTAHNGIVNYVDSIGKTSAEVNKNGIIWVRAESNGRSSWYGLDNSSGFFENGSRFWVKWLSAETDRAEYQKYFNRLDDVHKKQVAEGKLRLFLTGVTNPDGTEYTNLPIRLPYYMQLGSDLSENNINALLVFAGTDKAVESEFNTVTYFKNKYRRSEFPESSGRYARLILNSFAPCIVYNRASNTNPVHPKPSENTENINTVGANIFDSNDVVYRVKQSENGKRYGESNEQHGYSHLGNENNGDDNHIISPNDVEGHGIFDEKDDYTGDTTNIPPSMVKFLTLEEAIAILLLGILNFVCSIIHKKRKNDDADNKSL